MSSADLKAFVCKVDCIAQEQEKKGEEQKGDENTLQRLYRKFYHIVCEQGDIGSAIEICSQILQEVGNSVEKPDTPLEPHKPIIRMREQNRFRRSTYGV